VEAIARILSSRGGAITRETIRPLIQGGTLLSKADPAHVQSASYDLRVGDEIWCQGTFVHLGPGNELFEIPPYSYAIVKAHETAALPPFLVGEFDIKVSHFLSGVILSNGPQVDPGYHGDLFCMLFNGSSVARPLRLGDHFSTIQFFTTIKSGDRYRGYYSLRDKLVNAMPPEAARGPGGAIFSRIDEKIEAAVTRVRSEIPKERTGWYTFLISVAIAVPLAVAAWAVTATIDASKAASEARSATQQIKELTATIEKREEEKAKALSSPADAAVRPNAKR
jgi:deoxycytidine triphosphate deaminase